LVIIEQLRTNAVAIISLVVALSGLGYNTWRNESTESNKNVREAGFFMMQELTKLQEVVLYAHFDRDDDRGDIKSGWAHVLAVRDISYAMPESVQQDALALSVVWQQNAQGILSNQDESYQQVDKAIDQVKKRIVDAISELK
jgi:hypothetical protein